MVALLQLDGRHLMTQGFVAQARIHWLHKLCVHERHDAMFASGGLHHASSTFRVSRLDFRVQRKHATTKPLVHCKHQTGDKIQGQCGLAHPGSVWESLWDPPLRNGQTVAVLKDAVGEVLPSLHACRVLAPAGVNLVPGRCSGTDVKFLPAAQE